LYSHTRRSFQGIFVLKARHFSRTTNRRLLSRFGAKYVYQIVDATLLTFDNAANRTIQNHAAFHSHSSGSFVCYAVEGHGSILRIVVEST